MNDTSDFRYSSPEQVYDLRETTILEENIHVNLQVHTTIITNLMNSTSVIIEDTVQLGARGFV